MTVLSKHRFVPKIGAPKECDVCGRRKEQHAQHRSNSLPDDLAITRAEFYAARKDA